MNSESDKTRRDDHSMDSVPYSTNNPFWPPDNVRRPAPLASFAEDHPFVASLLGHSMSNIPTIQVKRIFHMEHGIKISTEMTGTFRWVVNTSDPFRVYGFFCCEEDARAWAKAMHQDVEPKAFQVSPLSEKIQDENVASGSEVDVPPAPVG